MPRWLKGTSFLLILTMVFGGGCANLSQNEWLNKENIGAVTGTALGILVGSKIGNGSGRTAAMLVGAMLGGVLGKSIGAKLDEADRAALAEKTRQALQYTKDGEATNWTSPRTGASARITPVSTQAQVREVAVKRIATVQAVPNMKLLNQTWETVKSANVRNAPDTKAEKVGGLQVGSTFTAIGRTDNNWVMVGRRGVSIGYVYAPLAKPVEQVVPVSPSQNSTVAVAQAAPATDLDAMDQAGAQQQGFDLDSIPVVDDRVAVQTTCRTLDYQLSVDGEQENKTVQACQAVDGAWELI